MEYQGTKNYMELGGKIISISLNDNDENTRGRTFASMILQTEGRKRKGVDEPILIDHMAIILDDKAFEFYDRFSKGDNVVVKGHTKVSMYDNSNDGVDRITEIVVDTMDLLPNNESRNRMELIGEIITTPKEKILDKENNKRLTTMLVRTFAKPREGLTVAVPVRHAVVGFNELSDKIQGEFRKGDKVSIVGYSKVTTYSNSNKGTDSVTELVVEEANRVL